MRKFTGAREERETASSATPGGHRGPGEEVGLWARNEQGSGAWTVPRARARATKESRGWSGLEEVPSGSQFRCCSVGIDICRGTLV